MRNLSDTELISNFRNRRNEILEEIYNRYSHLVYGVCLKYLESRDDSLDAVVEIFEILLEKIPEHTITNFKSWLYSLTKNHCLMKLRKIKRQQESFNKHFTVQQEFYEPEVMEREMFPYEKIEQALEYLTEEQRICIEMFYYQQKSYVNIADETGFSIKSVKSYLQNGKIKLKKIIDEQYENT
jgi:RNA polymerase sigma-70 factor (ECF subfamily)